MELIEPTLIHCIAQPRMHRDLNTGSLTEVDDSASLRVHIIQIEWHTDDGIILRCNFACRA